MQDDLGLREGFLDCRLDRIAHDVGTPQRHVGVQHDMELDELGEARGPRAQVVRAAHAGLAMDDVENAPAILFRQLVVHQHVD